MCLYSASLQMYIFHVHAWVNRLVSNLLLCGADCMFVVTVCLYSASLQVYIFHVHAQVNGLVSNLLLCSADCVFVVA